MKRIDKIVLSLLAFAFVVWLLLSIAVDSSWEYAGSRKQWRRNRLTHEVQYREDCSGCAYHNASHASLSAYGT